MARARRVGSLRGLLTNQKTGKPLTLRANDWHYEGAADVIYDPSPSDLLRDVVGEEINLTGYWEQETSDVRQDVGDLFDWR